MRADSLSIGRRMRFVAVSFLVLALAACAAQVQTTAQREQQAQKLRENGARLRLLVLDSTKADVQSLMGVASTRNVFRVGPDDVDEWFYPHEEGWAVLRFVGGKLVEHKTQRTPLVFARDVTVPLTQEDINIHLALSIVKLGWTKSDVESLAVKPSIRWTESQAAEEVRKFRATLASLKDSPMLVGADMSGVSSRDMSGEWWLYQGPRLNGMLILRGGRVAQIGFSEQGTKAQQNETIQKGF